jgi:hypothetical protein
MRLAALFIGALVSTAPLFSQTPAAGNPRLHDGEPRWFLLTETRDQVTRALGQPAMVADFGQDFQSWQYQIGDIDHHEFSHQLVFLKSDRALISVTRNYEPERTFDELFPEAETTVHHYPNLKNPQYSLRLRLLSGGRVLMAMGAPKAGQPTGQLVLIRKSELRYFYPWLFEQLSGKSSEAR